MENGPVKQFLDSEDFDGFLIHDSSSNSSLYYLTRFESSDAFTYLATPDKTTVAVPQLEYSRAVEEAKVDEVVGTGEFVEGESRGETEKTVSIISGLLERQGVEKVVVPGDFPFGLAEELEQRGTRLKTGKDIVMEARMVKSRQEVQKLRDAQKLAERAMEEVRDLVRRSVARDGKLYLDGEKLGSERVRRHLKMFLLERGCEVPEEFIVACGCEGARPHSRGQGDLEAGKPVVVDIFPRKDRYFGDMSRTFVKGEPGEEALGMWEAVREAKQSALEVLEKGAGTTTSEIHNRVCDVLERHGYGTLRTGAEEKGFIHSTGHGVGLDLHEPPRVAGNDIKLEAGNVLTIEPGLYLPETGGVRLEDMVVVEKNGYENFNSMDEDLVVG